MNNRTMSPYSPSLPVYSVEPLEVETIDIQAPSMGDDVDEGDTFAFYSLGLDLETMN